jgi:hypothetical protein
VWRWRSSDPSTNTAVPGPRASSATNWRNKSNLNNVRWNSVRDVVVGFI